MFGRALFAVCFWAVCRLTVSGSASATPKTEQLTQSGAEQITSVWAAAPPDHRDLWTWCTAQPTLIEDFDLLLDPYPLRPGRNFNLHLRGILKEEVPDVRIRTLVVLNRFIRIPHTRNLCSEQPGLCPIKPGYQELTISYAIPPVISGPISVDATVLSGSKEIACARMGPLEVAASGMAY
ncbi:ml domain protein [Cystoisospora suis]|uniref:Ml domain protein n=1 Tax=Cystoisospora suis TaxID=483139 RepID=A0A2C6KK42_9APIC|nr:ml domain protein [Cystoisospora suis]